MSVPTVAESTADVSIVICTASEARWQALSDAVESVRGQEPAPRELIIVVDHNEVLLGRVRTRWPDLVVIENRETRGLSGARNRGVEQAQGSVVAFLDDDAVAGANWLSTLLPPYGDSLVMCVGGSIEPVWPGVRPRWFPREFDWVVGCTYEGLPDRRAFVRNVIGANMSFRRAIFPEVGFFNSAMGRVGERPLGGEETEFCIRARHALPGHEIVYEPAARVEHQVSAGRCTWSYFVRRCYGEGRSKAQLSRLADPVRGLSSEARYVTRTLPRGVWRGMSDAVLHLDPFGIARASAIVLGLSATVFGYAIGTASGIRSNGARQRLSTGGLHGRQR